MSYEIFDPNQQPVYGPPPVRRSYTGWIVAGIIATTLVVMVVACGLGGAVLIGLSATPSATATPTPTSTTKPTSSTPTPTTQQAIHPAGAPYSWDLPSGFVPANAPAELRGKAEYVSAAVLKPSDTTNILFASAGTLEVDTGTLSPAALRQGVDEIVKGLGHDPKTGQALTVHGYSALRYEFTYATARAYSYFAFKGATAIQVLCRWSDEQQEITRGCDELLGTLTID